MRSASGTDRDEVISKSRFSLSRFVTILLLVQLGIILLTTPAGRFGVVIFGIRVSVGRNVYKAFPLFLLTSLAYFALTHRKIRWGAFSGPLAAVAAAVLLVSASSMDSYDSLKEGIRILLCTGFYVALINLPWEQARFRRILICFVLGVFLLTIKALYKVGSGAETRAGDFLGHPNVLGAFCVTVVPVLLLFAVFLPQRRWKVLFQTSACSLALALLLTFSRGAYLAAVGSMLFLAFAGGRAARTALAPMGTLLLISVVIAWPSVTGRIRETGLELHGERPESRIFIWDTTFQDAIPDMPLWGWGAEGGFTALVQSRERFRTDRPPAPRLAHPHNQVLDVLVAGGMPGLLAWVWLIVAAVGSIRKVPKWRGRSLRPFFFAPLIALGIVGLFESIVTSRNTLPTLVLLFATIEALPTLEAFRDPTAGPCKL